MDAPIWLILYPAWLDSGPTLDDDSLQSSVLFSNGQSARAALDEVAKDLLIPVRAAYGLTAGGRVSAGWVRRLSIELSNHSSTLVPRHHGAPKTRPETA